MLTKVVHEKIKDVCAADGSRFSCLGPLCGDSPCLAKDGEMRVRSFLQLADSHRVALRTPYTNWRASRFPPRMLSIEHIVPVSFWAAGRGSAAAVDAFNIALEVEEVNNLRGNLLFGDVGCTEGTVLWGDGIKYNSNEPENLPVIKSPPLKPTPRLGCSGGEVYKLALPPRHARRVRGTEGDRKSVV